jgi:glycosyltransferase involved in cell wall biosynthesis
MKTKKVLIFSTAYYPFVGGVEVAVKEMTDRMEDIEFDLITARFDKKLPFKEMVGNVTVYRLGIGISFIDKLLLPFEGALFARHLAKRKEYDAFWCIMATFASGAAYIYNLFSKKKIPIILNLQEGDSEEHFKTRWFGMINISWRLALSRTHFLTVLSQFLKERAVRLGYKGGIKIVPNGVDVEEFSKNINEEERIEIRKNLGIREEDVALITTSRLVIKNGVGDVIIALQNLPNNIKFVICGVGELEIGLRDLAKKLNVSERVIFVGNISREDLPKYLKACDIFIRPSLSEGFGNSFIEAMASKIPVIATPVGGIVDFLRDPAKLHRSEAGLQTGYFCDPKSPPSIVEAVNRVISDDKKGTVAQNAYKMVKDKYDWNIIASDMRQVFDNILEI